MAPSEFVKTVLMKYEKHEGVFEEHKNAEDLVPNLDKVSKSLFLFYVIQLDYATKSQRLYAGARDLFDVKPSFYTPQFVLKSSNLKLKKLLKDYLSPRYINEAVKRYKFNSKKLLKEYQGNPHKIFNSTTSAKEALKRVRDFRGFGPKIGNFFVRTMINTFGYNYSDVEELLPPVDVHDVRIAYLMGFISTDEMTNLNIKVTKKLWSEACHDAEISWLIFDKALWLLGSEGSPSSKSDILELLNI